MDDQPSTLKPIYVVAIVVTLLLAAGGIVGIVAGVWSETTQPDASQQQRELTASLQVQSVSSEIAPTQSPVLSNQPALSSTPILGDAPTFTKTDEVTIDGGNLWLFPIDDGQAGSVVLSTEQGGSIAMGRLNLNDLTEKMTWTKVASATDTGGEGIADHWHIFAHNAHWLVFSVTGADRSFLVKLDKNFRRLAFVPVANRDELTLDDLIALGFTNVPSDPLGSQSKPVTTNDMFLVAEPTGVAVGHMIPGVGTRIYRFDSEANFREATIVGGDDYQINNGSSARQTSTGFTIFGAETLNMVAQGAIKQVTTDFDWKPLAVKTLIDESRVNSAMATQVQLPSGYQILTLRAVTNAYPRGQLPPPAQPGQGLSDDSGTIVRYLLTADGQPVSREVLVESHGNRPHTIIKDHQLLTAWDTTGRVKLRIDAIND